MCAEDGALAMQSAALTLQGCAITGNKGPGLDVSSDAAATIQGRASPSASQNAEMVCMQQAGERDLSS